jgi:hypothetical protein
MTRRFMMSDDFTVFIRQLRDIDAAEGLVIGSAYIASDDAVRLRAVKETARLSQELGRVTSWLSARYAARMSYYGRKKWIASVPEALADAAAAFIVRDLLDPDDYDVLTRPVRLAGIVVHPDDPALPTSRRRARLCSDDRRLGEDGRR